MGLSKTDKQFLKDNARSQMLDVWRNDGAYVLVPSFAVGSNGLVYKSTVSNGLDESGSPIGPGAVDPVGDLTGTWEEFATGGATGGGSDKAFVLFDRFARESYVLETNATTAGPFCVGKLLNISSIVGDGAVLTITVTDGEDRGHLCAIGDSFNISGTVNFDGDYTVASITDGFTLTASSAVVASESTGLFERDVVIQVGKTVNVTSISSDGTNITVTTDEQHTLATGEEFSISGTSNYDGTYTADVVSDSTNLTALSTLNVATENAGILGAQNVTWTVV